MTPASAKAARELLAFYVEAGVESFVGEAPVDRFADPAVTLPPVGRVGATRVPPAAGPSVNSGAGVGVEKSFTAPPPSPTLPHKGGGSPRSVAGTSSPTVATPVSPEVAAMTAREAARSAQTLDELRAIVGRFEGCALKSMAKQLVFADGDPQARLMFVGEAPGREEDLEGLPFVGPSGRLLERMLQAIGLDRTKVYIANIIPWRPPGNRDPSPQETQTCLPFIQRQIELVDPDVLVCLGRPSTAALLGVNDGIKRTRGRWFTYHTGKREIRAMPTFHPAFLLRSPLEKRHVWRDLLAIKKALQN